MNEEPASYVESALREECFIPLGWFDATPDDNLGDVGVGRPVRTVLLIGNAGPQMWKRFSAERGPGRDTLDEWSAEVLGELARRLGARVYFPFDKPPFPFQSWARRTGHVHASPLGITIHPTYGLWHAYRGLFAFPDTISFEPQPQTDNPCDTCTDRPCLSTCPVLAFKPGHYDVPRCVDHVVSPEGADCLQRGCRARRACPVGKEYIYSADQALFHMSSFVRPFEKRR
jgi:hypothetical protein